MTMGRDINDFAQDRTDDELRAVVDRLPPRMEPQIGFSDTGAGDKPALPGIVRASAWHGRLPPPRRWIVPEMIPARTVTLFTGHGGLGKSIIMLQLLAAAATGGTWLGRDVERCPAFGLFAEDELDELHRRVAAICAATGTGLDRLDDLSVASLADDPAVLAERKGADGRIEPTRLYATVRDHARSVGARLVVLDPAADLFGGDEIDRVQVRTFLGLLRRLAIDIDGAVVLTAHPSREGLRTETGYSGSTAWHNSVRSLLFLTRPKAEDGESPNPDIRELRHLKSNLGPPVADMRLRWADGIFVPEDGVRRGMVEVIEDGRAEKAFLNGLRAATAQGRNLSAHRNQPNYAPKVIAGMQEGRGFSKQILTTSMEALFNKGCIVIGTPFLRGNRHRATGLVIVGEESR